MTRKTRSDLPPPPARRGRALAATIAAVAVSACLAGAPAMAEGGSIGGAIGDAPGGSIGGSIAAPAPAAKPVAPQYRRPVFQPRGERAPRRERAARRAPIKRKPRGGAFDGRWSLSTASSCAGNGTGTFRVYGTRLIQGRGTVSPSGAFYAADRVHGLRNVYTGRLSGNSGGGSYRREDGCLGSWSAYRSG